MCIYTLNIKILSCPRVNVTAEFFFFDLKWTRPPVLDKKKSAHCCFDWKTIIILPYWPSDRSCRLFFLLRAAWHARCKRASYCGWNCSCYRTLPYLLERTKSVVFLFFQFKFYNIVWSKKETVTIFFYLHSPGYLHLMTPISSNSWQATFLIGTKTVCIFSASVANIPNFISCLSVLNCHLK